MREGWRRVKLGLEVTGGRSDSGSILFLSIHLCAPFCDFVLFLFTPLPLHPCPMISFCWLALFLPAPALSSLPLQTTPQDAAEAAGATLHSGPACGLPAGCHDVPVAGGFPKPQRSIWPRAGADI